MQKSDALVETLKAAPPVSVGGLTFFNVPLPDLVQLITIVWLVILIVTKLPELGTALRKIKGWFTGG